MYTHIYVYIIYVYILYIRVYIHVVAEARCLDIKGSSNGKHVSWSEWSVDGQSVTEARGLGIKGPSKKVWIWSRSRHA